MSQADADANRSPSSSSGIDPSAVPVPANSPHAPPSAPPVPPAAPAVTAGIQPEIAGDRDEVDLTVPKPNDPNPANIGLGDLDLGDLDLGERGSASPIPPPPPARSTLPPIRPPKPTSVSGGVGTAAGIRWRGELDGVGATPNQNNLAGAKSSDTKPSDTKASGTGRTATQQATEKAESNPHDVVAREAPPWLVSMVMHLILLLVLALVSSPAGHSLGQVVLSIGQSQQQSLFDLAEFEVADTSELVESNDTEDNVDTDDIMKSMFETVTLSEVEQVETADFGVGMEAAAIERPMFNGRSGAMKQALLAMYGGTPKTQDAVARGLAWLKRNQHDNGRWSMRGPYRDGGFAENDVAATSMALLAFLGDGNTHLDGEYSAEVMRGVKHLIKQQDRKGWFSRKTQIRAHEKMYAQAQATIAICELYAMTGDSWLRRPAQDAIDFAVDAQSPRGGWRYRPYDDADTSVTGWFVMAIESAIAGGLDIDRSVFVSTSSFLDSVADYDQAAYSYLPRQLPSAPMTAEGLLCRQYIGWRRAQPSLHRGINAMLMNEPFDIDDPNVYYWYYATQVLHHFGGEPWEFWNNVMREDLPDAQVRSGPEDGSWSPQSDIWGERSGRLYTTCLSIYCLEVYYRHMPLYQSESHQR